MKYIYELVPYETWCLWMVKSNFKQACKDYGIHWYSKRPARGNYQDIDEFIICTYLWKLNNMSLGKRLECIKSNIELSKKYRD